MRALLMMAQGQSLSGWTSLAPLVIMLGIFYFLLIAPMRKRQKNVEEMITSLKNGDRVITSGGVFGTVAGLRENSVVLKVADQVKIEVAKSAITSMQVPKESQKS